MMATTCPSLPRLRMGSKMRGGLRYQRGRGGGRGGESCCSVTNKTGEGRPLYNPTTYQEMVGDAALALKQALEGGERFVEVQMPSLPGGLEMEQRGSSDDFQMANLRLAIAAAKRLGDAYGKVLIALPDAVEKNFYEKQLKQALEYTPGVSLGAVSDGGIMGFFTKIFGNENSDKEGEPDLIMFCNSSTVELPAMEQYIKEKSKGVPVVLFNLELDTLRSDLGLLGFPPKTLHYDFLSKFRPAYYIRQRDYSKTIAEPPFVVNYSGMLFREYPGPWQVMLKQTDGSFACVAEDSERFSLFDVKEELLNAVGLNTDAEGSAMQFLRQGYKKGTWWEEELVEEKSNAWRS